MDFANNRRTSGGPDRRLMPRGGRRLSDVPGSYPPVLVGESDEGARRVFVRALERFGFQILEAATGEEALALAQGCLPSVVVAELTLPRDDAFQAYVRARRIPYVVTVTTDEGVVPQGAVAVLEKPFPLSALLNAVLQVLRTGHSPVAA